MGHGDAGYQGALQANRDGDSLGGDPTGDHDGDLFGDFRQTGQDPLGRLSLSHFRVLWLAGLESLLLFSERGWKLPGGLGQPGEQGLLS